MKDEEEIEYEEQMDRYATNVFPDKYGAPGLTKREFFAIMVLQGVISFGAPMDYTVEKAVLYADALIKELEK